MPPNSTASLKEENHEKGCNKNIEYKTEIVWFNVGLFIFLHASMLYGAFLAITSGFLKTFLFGIFYGYWGMIGITAGSHRLWTHRSYKAKWPLRVLYCIFASISAQNDIFVWSRDHRVHHKFADTNADPHNINRGFFFAHMGWLMCKKHPDVIEKGKYVYLNDLLADPIVRFHRRFYFPMAAMFCIVLPTMIPFWFWGETLWNSFFIAAMLRYGLSLHGIWLVNSAAHYSGELPFNKYIEARENRLVQSFGIGEGCHNFHHTFPWDYATSELGHVFDFAKIFIDFMAYLGLAYDLKTVPPDVAERQKLKLGDGTRLKQHELKSNEIHKIS